MEEAKDTSDVIALEIAKQKDANVTKIILNVIAGVIIRGRVAIKIKNYISLNLEMIRGRSSINPLNGDVSDSQLNAGSK